MPSDPDQILLLAMAIADVLVAGGWLLIAALVAALAQGHVRTQGNKAPLPPPPPYAFAWMAAALLMWPVGLIAGPIYLAKPETARMGRNVLFVGLTNITVTVLLTYAGMYWLAGRHPEWFQLILPTI